MNDTEKEECPNDENKKTEIRENYGMPASGVAQCAQGHGQSPGNGEAASTNMVHRRALVNIKKL